MTAPPSDLVHLNGALVPRADARLSPDDRGFLFADGVYEVVRFYDGRPFRLADHVARLARSLAAIRLGGFDAERFADIAHGLVEANGLGGPGDATVYLQVTRGAGRRTHAFPPAGTPPTVFAQAAPLTAAPERWTRGVAAVTAPDERWARCDVKAVALLPNVLAHQAAREAGAEEAVFVRNGLVTEGTHTNVAAVFDGTIRTAPLGPQILPGVTRRAVLEFAAAHGLPFVEEAFAAADLARADEVFLMSTTSEVLPVVAVDGRPVGAGTPGPVAAALLAALRAAARPA